MTRRGKYTLEIRRSLLISELAPSAMVLLKNIHGIMAEKTMRVYGTPSEGSPATRPKIMTKMIMVSNGLMTAQAMPMAVCL